MFKRKIATLILVPGKPDSRAPLGVARFYFS